MTARPKFLPRANHRRCTLKYAIAIAILGALAQGCTPSSGSSGTEDGCISTYNCGEDISSQATDASSGDTTSSPGDVAFNDTIALSDDATTVTFPIPNEWDGATFSSPKFFGKDNPVGHIVPSYGLDFPIFAIAWSEIDQVDIVGKKFHFCHEGGCGWIDLVQLKTS